MRVNTGLYVSNDELGYDKMKTLAATLEDGQTIEYLPELIAEGGMKRVYLTKDRQSVICFFKESQAGTDPDRAVRLAALVGPYNPTAGPNIDPFFREAFRGWPTAIVALPAFGVVAPVYPDWFYFESGRFAGRSKEAKWFTSPRLRRLLPPRERGTWLHSLQWTIRLAAAIKKLHSMGIAHSDLSARNVVVDPLTGCCAVIGTDALVIPGLSPPDILGTPGYVAPEDIATKALPLDDAGRKPPSIQANLHSLAVLIHEFLLSRHPLRGPKLHSTESAEEDERLSMGEKALFIEHPRDSSNRPRNLKVTYEDLGPTIGTNARRFLPNLFYLAFVEGLHNPTVRPTAHEWERALCRTTDLLIPCGNPSCDEKWFIYIEQEKPRCPFCSWKLQEQIPVLEFYYAPRRGQWRPEGHCLVAWNQRPLHVWHIFRDRQPTVCAENESQAYVAFHQGRWILVNKHLDSLLSASDTPVPIGQACLLRERDKILLSTEKSGRRVRVRMIP